jgi:CheY-like chemotaxis protein
MKRQNRASLALERLEERRVPATIYFSKGGLFISNPTINAGSTSLTISQVATNRFTVTDGASFNGTFSGVNHIDYTGTNFKDEVNFDLNRFKCGGSALFKTGNGDDRLDVRAAGGSLGGNLTALTGLGNDTVDLHFSGAGAIMIGGSFSVSDTDGSYTLLTSHSNAVSSLTQFGTVTSEAHDHSIPNQNSNGGGPEASGGPLPEPREKSSPRAWGNAAAAPRASSEPLGSLSFIFASLTIDREAPGPGPEAKGSGAPVPITRATLWSCSATGLSTDHRPGDASAVVFGYVGESVKPGSQALDALPTGGSSVGAGLTSRGGQTTAGILASTNWLQVPGGGPALEADAVTTRLGAGQIAVIADSAGSGPLENTSEVTLGFILAGSLALHLGPQAERPTLLLVESDEPTRDAMTMMLFAEGYQVVAVATGRDAWNVLRSPFTPIDIMLLDVHLPDISGLHLVQRLRPTYPALPVFAWMHGSEPAVAAQLDELGVFHFARGQSVESTELVETVRAYLRSASHDLE